MSIPVITFFNNKGGVGKTSMVYHLAWMFADRGRRAGFTPIPYKIITISAAAFDISFAISVVASALSRAARFFLVAYLLWRYGEPIRDFIDRRFNLLSILFVILLVGGFGLIKLWSH